MPTIIIRHLLFGVILLAATGGWLASSSTAQGGDRTRKWPPKTKRALLTDAQVRRARALCDKNPAAAAIRKKYVVRAEYWIKIADEDLHDLLPDARVPRAFNVSTEGCPVHGKAIYKFGTYPWKLDRDRPFTVICPVGGERYPSNDFAAYYRGGMKDRSLLTGPHADPGRGWVAPNGQRYWLVGYACHWNWQQTWLPAITDLSRAYLLTGKRIYARKAVVMLDRVAEVYPAMDYSKQSRYAQRMHGRYYGKILNAIWETGVFRNLAIAYDNVFDALVGDDPVALPWRSAAAIRANIEANLLEEGIEAIDRVQIAGNFGMHQSALAYAAVVRQAGPTRQLLDSILTHTGSSYRLEGLDYALYNLVFKDGMPYETAPGYCFSWVGNFVLMAKPLALAGIDLYQDRKFPRMFDAPLRMICTGAFTPAIGDAGSIDAGWIGPQAYAYREAFRHFRQPRYAWALEHLGGLRTDPPRSFDELFEQPINKQARVAARAYTHQPPSRLLDGYGLAILNNRSDSLAVSMYYGIRGGHGHYDRLNLELFAHDRRVAPDLGYPDFMNAFVPGIFGWSKNTVSHNCLVVDEGSQPGNHPGNVLRFHDSPTVHVVDVDAPGTYPQTSVYRRTLVLVDTGKDDGYLVDVFRVRGGRTHLLSLHGGPGTFAMAGASLPPPVATGTLAGKDVPYGRLYDNPKLAQPGYSGSYGGYRGSGYSYFFNWQQTTPADVATATWRFAKPAAGQLRVHLPPHPGQELIVADAYVSPTRKVPTILKYVLVKRAAKAAGTTFVAVWEPVSGKPLLDRVEPVAGDFGTGCNRAVALRIHRGEVVDTVVVAAAPGRRVAVGAEVKTDAAVAVVSDRRGRRTRLFAAGGTTVTGRPGTQPARIPATVAGKIKAVDYRKRELVVTTWALPSDPSVLVGLTVRVWNDHHACVYPIAAAKAIPSGLTLRLAGPDLFTGRIRIDRIDAGMRRVVTATKVLYPWNLAGMTLVTDDLRHHASIASMAAGTIQLAPTAPIQAFAADRPGPQVRTAWVADFGVGDQVEIERSVHRRESTAR